MNREQAKLELDITTLRPQDASDEAKAMAQSDQSLGAWLIQRTAFDEKVADASAANTSVPNPFNTPLLP
jgi:hypothetical protein